MGPRSALALRTLADARTRTVSFALGSAAVAAANVAGYRHTYPTAADRAQFALTFGANKAARLFYGTPYRLETVGGYAAWRAGGVLAIVAAAFGLLAAVRAFRTEEDAGRAELVAAGAFTRAGAFGARVAAAVATVGALALAVFAGLAGSGLPAAQSGYLALGLAAAALVYLGAGAVASQLLPTRREALAAAGGLLALDLLVRVLADTTDHQSLHWAAPLGWVEELRPFAGARPAPLVPLAAAAAALLAVALGLARRRDLGTGLVGSRGEERAPRLRLLGSPLGLALRSSAVGLAVWAASVAAFAFTIGTVSKTVSSAGLSPAVRRRLAELGGGDVATPSGYIGLTFLFFVLALALYSCAQAAAAREEEASGRLETLLALPLGRARWLGGRIALAAAGLAVLGLLAGVGAAAGAAVVGADVSAARVVAGGLNCVPAAALFLGLAALAAAAVPRAAAALAYGLVAASFLLELVGALLGLPSWLVSVSPFHHVALVPAASFRPLATGAMLLAGAAAAGAAVALFGRRDLAAG